MPSFIIFIGHSVLVKTKMFFVSVSTVNPPEQCDVWSYPVEFPHS